MAKYIECEAAIAYIKENQCKRCSDIGLCGKCAVLSAVKLFESVPAADVVEVVRCKDCINHRQSGLCEGWSRYGTINTPDDAFCSWGVKIDV